MEKYIGNSFRKGPDTVPLEYVMETQDFVGVYFGAHWAPPCRAFTEVLTEFYKTTNEVGKRLEVVFVSNDGNEAAFERNFAEMPWVAVPYTDQERGQNLRQQFGVSGIPSFVVLHKTGEFVSMDARQDV